MNLLLATILLAIAPGQSAHSKFASLCETGWGEKIDTYHETLTKDLVGRPDTTIHFVLQDPSAGPASSPYRPTAIQDETQASPRPHFDFMYSQGLGTRISTYDSTMTKDEVIDPDTTIHFVLPKADVDSVYNKMMEIHFFDMEEPHPVWPVPCPGGFVPNTQIRLEATLGDKTRQLEWSSDKYPCIMQATGDWQGLRELEHMILQILYRQPEYQALPEPRGSYR